MGKEQLPASDVYKVVRGQVEHLVTQVSQRIIWLVIAQSFFFNGYALLVVSQPLDHLKGTQELLLWIFPIASLLAVILSYIDVLTSMHNLRNLRKWYERVTAEKDVLDDYPPVTGTGLHRRLEQASPIFLPLVFILTWVYILIKNYTPLIGQ